MLIFCFVMLIEITTICEIVLKLLNPFCAENFELYNQFYLSDVSTDMSEFISRQLMMTRGKTIKSRYRRDSDRRAIPHYHSLSRDKSVFTRAHSRDFSSLFFLFTTRSRFSSASSAFESNGSQSAYASIA